MNAAITAWDIARMIDHSLLHPTLTDAQLDAGCALAVAHDVATVCVKPYYVPRAAELVAGSDVLVCSVIGFPHGNSHTSIKVQETLLALAEGAREIDMVVNAGRVLGGQFDDVAADIRAVNDLSRARRDPQGNFRKRLPAGESHSRTLPDLQRDRRRVRENLHGLRFRQTTQRRLQLPRCDRPRSSPDAPTVRLRCRSKPPAASALSTTPCACVTSA